MGKKSRRPELKAAATPAATFTPPPVATPPSRGARWRGPVLIVLMATVRLVDRYRKSSNAKLPDLKPLVATNPDDQPLVLVAEALFNGADAMALRRCVLEHPLIHVGILGSSGSFIRLQYFSRDLIPPYSFISSE